MKHNEQGFILPVVLAFCALFLLLVAQQTTYFVTKSSFYQEVEQKNRLQHLLENAVVHVKKEIKEHNKSPSASLVLETGTVSYEVVSEDEQMIILKINCQTLQGRALTETAYIQKKDQHIVKWTD
ncbi:MULTISPECIES: competence type IV pilus minor pilin ComGG [Priestia]|uniref:competence type IV pilus minor pilin ComGG n=1 Tax=Priestia TaxID=2800373 RepID=UPI000BECC29D|nr:competence type IV pilus minor pilin ComGG [Priestia megaterium]MBZ5478007.1 competence protein ComG [Bacillus sp. T_4]MDP9577419.1 competence protein ComGG [Bacillus sp. 1751]MBU8584662.1 competence protein ComG [Priestia megaterium]MDD9794042.1 competence type IV pilus minor pilin ComGG [Priestia megaterium]MDH2359093.1 competence type IV pilus minor pilin ComGG [Priestia megaterium]